MFKVFDAYIMDHPELERYVQHAADIGANAPNDSYLEDTKGPFLLVPVCNTTDDERLMAVIEFPQRDSLPVSIPELPEVLNISEISVIDGSVASPSRLTNLLVFLEVPTKDTKDFTVFPRRLPQEFVKKCRSFGLEFLSKQMRQYGEAEAADKMLAEARKIGQ